MIQLTLFLNIFLINFIFMNMNHPLAMGLTLLMQTLLICLMSGLISKTFWFSYILFLVFIGGLLILFIYVTSLASNEMFSFSMKLLIISSFFIIICMIMMLFIDKNLLFQYKNMETNQIIELDSYISENSMLINKLYNYPNNLLTILLMNYLFITLIVVVKITKLFKGPLRTMFN